LSDPLREKVLRIEAALSEAYGKPVWQGPGDILEELVLTILSQNTSDTNSGRAFRLLKQRYGTMEAVADAAEDEIAAVIAPAGLAAQKAPRIAAVLQDARARFGSASLEALRGWDTEAVRDYLRSFPGVGPKTVACVLLFAMGRPVMPVDTHVGRVAARLGLVPENASSDAVHEMMERITPDDIMYALHVGLIRHGRTVCRPARPRCEECVVRCECVWKGPAAERRTGAAGAREAARRPMRATRRRSA
jgi:endonuclease-3